MLVSVSSNVGNQKTKQVSMMRKSDLSKVMSDCMNPINGLKLKDFRKFSMFSNNFSGIKGSIAYFKNSKLKFEAEIDHIAGRKDFTITKFDKKGQPSDIIEYFG